MRGVGLGGFPFLEHPKPAAVARVGPEVVRETTRFLFRRGDERFDERERRVEVVGIDEQLSGDHQCSHGPTLPTYPAGMELSPAIEFARSHRQGVLTTIRKDGRPQLSNIIYAVDGAGVIRISVTITRAKTKNLQRDPRASLYVCGESFWAYVVIDGPAELTPVAAGPNDATVDELVELYRAMAGEHDNWDEYRAAMVADGRLVVKITPTSAYGMLPA